MSRGKEEWKKKIKIKKLLFLNIKNLKPIQFTCYKSVLKLKFVQAWTYNSLSE